MRLAKQAGVKRAVIFSSYFVTCHQMWPELKLSESHPYIKSRVEQIEAARRVAGDEMTVSFLALPYIFGAMPGRMPLWAPLSYLESALPWVFYPAGGAARWWASGKSPGRQSGGHWNRVSLAKSIPSPVKSQLA